MIETILQKNPNLQFVNLDNEYKNTSSAITYICTEHGQLSRKAYYLIEGRGCSKCASELARKSKKSTSDFIERSKKIHNNYYQYTNTIYTKSHDKVLITCPYHGEFSQLAYIHLQGKGCPDCGKIRTSHSSYLSSSNSSMTTLYYIKCYRKGEIFYKIGVTTNTVSNRYNSIEAMPYLYEVLREITGDTESILNLEKIIKLNIDNYSPIIPFDGSATECTLNEIDLDSYLEMV